MLVFGTLKMAQNQGGAVPQNVNFAISAAVAVNFLNVKGMSQKFSLRRPRDSLFKFIATEAGRFAAPLSGAAFSFLNLP
jgi:hypothetical protein